MNNSRSEELPSPPIPVRRSLRTRNTGSSTNARTNYDESLELLDVTFAESESMESETEEEEEGDDEMLQLKIMQAGDGTNDSLATLSESAIRYVKNDRGYRQVMGTKDVTVEFNPEKYLAATQRMKYKSQVSSTFQSAEKSAKKPRKGNRTGKTRNDSLPERPTYTSSVSADIAKLKLESSRVPSMKHEEEVELLMADIAKDFPRWQYILRENFNIVLYGFGSKEPILQSFKSFLNDEFMIVDINGHFPKLKPKNVLLSLWEALDISGDESLATTGHNILAMADEMYRILSTTTHPSVYFVIHGLDKLAVEQPKLFGALCTLSQVRYLHLIASVDHINTGLGMGHGLVVDLNIYWMDSTTFAKYEEELNYTKQELSHVRGDESAKSSLEQVWKSLTANAKKAFHILANLQLDVMKASGQSSHKNFPGVPFSELLHKCREAFIAHGEMPLRSLLTEFLDHKLIRYAGKGKKIDNLLIVNIETQILEDFVKS